MKERLRGAAVDQTTLFAKEFVPTVIKAIPVGIGLGLASVGGITWRHHRELTHKSLELDPYFQKMVDLEERTIGMDPTIWASVHRIHHQMADASLFPFYQISRAARWLEDNPEMKTKVQVPDEFKHLDPFVDIFTRDQVLQIGMLADEEIKTRLGSEYKEPDWYSEKELSDLFNPTEPLYWYDADRRQAGKYSTEEMARILLTDPHSPALQRPKNGRLNGVRAEILHNVRDYKVAGNLFKAEPALKPDDLKRETDDQERHVVADILAGFGLASVAALVIKGKYQPKDIGLAIVAGSAANGVKMLAGLSGGNITNGLGHDGPLTARDLLRALSKKDYQIKINPDGSISTNTVYTGFIGRILSWITYDEVGGQDEHHKFPDKIAYTSRTGRDAIIDAPWGSFTSYLAHNKNFGFINPGKGFDLKEGEKRPDMPHEGVEIIQSIRAAQFAASS